MRPDCCVNDTVPIPGRRPGFDVVLETLQYPGFPLVAWPARRSNVARFCSADDSCPQVTVSAWIKIEPHPNQMIFGTDGGPHMLASGSLLTLRNGGKDIRAQDVIYANGGWMFVAAVWDAGSRTHRLYWRGRSLESAMGDRASQAKPALWLGALNDALHYGAKDLVIDEFRVVGSALTEAAIADLRAGSGVGGAVAAATEPAAGSSCASSADCSTGSYCAMDRTCHPDSHRPLQASAGSGTTLADFQESMAERNAERTGDIDYESPTNILSGGDTTTDDGMTLEEMQAQMAARNAERTGDIDYDSPTDMLSGAGTTSDDGMTLEEMQAEMAARNADRIGDVDYQSPANILPSGGNGSASGSDDASAGQAEQGDTARVCTVTMQNHYTRLYAFSVNETPEERDNQQQLIFYSLDNLAWRYLSVYLDGAGRLGRNFRYELTVD